jgi:succinate dehydrogenase / fumarate reductase flavoprotein subunit
MDQPEALVPGLYAAGEAACASVHGANRLGTNSLLDIVVFGKVGGQKMREYAKTLPDFGPLAEKAGARGMAEVASLLNAKGSERMGAIMEHMQETMDQNCGVFRTEESLLKQREIMADLRARFTKVELFDHGRTYNLDLIET